MFTVHILINKTSWNVTLDDRTHLLTPSSFIWEDTPPRPTPPPSVFTVIASSWSSKSHIFLTVSLSLNHSVSSDKPKAQNLFRPASPHVQTKISSNFVIFQIYLLGRFGIQLYKSSILFLVFRQSQLVMYLFEFSYRIEKKKIKYITYHD